MKDIIYIGEPFIEEAEGKAYLKAEIKCGKDKKYLKYGVDDIYKKYLCYERSDAFVVSMLYYAMINGLDIQWETPCNEQLIYQLTTYFIPIYATEFEWVHSIELKGPTTNESIQSERAAATGLSNGVDSIYTVKKYLTMQSKFKLSYVLFTDCFTTDNSKKYQEDFLHNYLNSLPNCAEELGVGFIFVEFHIDEDFSIGHIQDKRRGVIQDTGLFTLKYCSLALALSKLIGVYYFSGGVSPSDFSFKKNDMAYHDIFTLPLISTQDCWFYSTGLEVNRLKKVEFIADWDYTKKYLQVCAWDNDKNCGHCSKCIRTMNELDALGKLHMYKERFPVDDYYANYSKRMGHVLMESWHGHIFEIDTLNYMKKQKKKIPVSSYVWGIFYYMVDYARRKLRTNKFARSIYRKYNLDQKLYGRSTKDYSLSVDRMYETDGFINNKKN